MRDSNNNNSTTTETEKMISLYHTRNPNPNQCTSLVIQSVRAPLPLIWSILRRFDQPQAYKKLIRNCTLLSGGGGAGSVREVALVSGMPGRLSRERLDRLDEENHVMIYTVVEGDQRLENYESTTTVHEAEDGGGAVVIESYVVDVPEGNSEEETRVFADTVLGCHLRYLAYLTEKLA